MSDRFCLHYMHKLIYFLKKIYIPLIFLLIEIIAIAVYAGSTPYSQSRMLSINHYVTGWTQRLFTEVSGYFALRNDNIALTEHIAELENKLNAYQSLIQEQVDISVDLQSSQYIAARIVSNSINRPHNYIVVNKGLSDGVRIGMSVLSAEGFAVGSITNCSQNFSIASSILNTSLKISARLSEDGSMGLANWRGGDAHIMEFSDITKYAQISVGDTVEAIDFSEYFPSGTIIGTIESFELNDDQTMYNCRLKIAADMSRINNVILVDNHSIDEVRRLKSEPEPTPNPDEYNIEN